MRIKEQKRPVDLDQDFEKDLISVSTFDYDKNHSTYELQNERDIWVNVANEQILITTEQGYPYTMRKLPVYKGNPVCQVPVWCVESPNGCPEEYAEIQQLKKRMVELNNIIINKNK
jgi:hypothetical protein